MFRRSQVLLAAFALTAVACSDESQSSSSRDPDANGIGDTSDGGTEPQDGGGVVDSGLDASSEAEADAHSSGNDGSVEANANDAAPLGPFGQTQGTDPCSRAGEANAPAWVASQRCNARTGRSNIVSTQTGTLKFTHDLNSGSGTSNYSSFSTFATDGTIYGQGDFIAALDPLTHATRWSWWGGSVGPVVAPNGNIIVTDGSSSPSVASLNPATGASNWLKTFPLYTRQEASVLPNGNIAVTTNGTLVVLDPSDGETLSTQTIGNVLGPLTIDADGIAYIAFSDRISAIDVATQQIVWTVTTKASSVMLDEQTRTLYFFYPNGSGSRLGTMSAIDGSGLALSSYTFELGNRQSALSLGDDGWVYLVANSQIRGVNMQSQEHWESVVTGEPSAPVVGGDGTLYLAETGSDVTVAAFSKTGTLRWRKTLGAATTPTSPGSFVSIAPTGHLYVSAAGANAKLYVLGD